MHHTLVASCLLKGVGLSSCRGLITLDVMSCDENAICWNHISRLKDQVSKDDISVINRVAYLEVDHITNQDLGDVNHDRFSGTDHLDLSILFLQSIHQFSASR